MEDGREIFDEDANEASSSSSSAKGKGKKTSKNPNIRAPGSQPKSIKSMFAAAAARPKKKVQDNASLGDDALLGDIMSELHQGPSPMLAPPMKLKKKAPARLEHSIYHKHQSYIP